MVLQTHSRITNSHSDSLSKSPAASSSYDTENLSVHAFSFSRSGFGVLLSYLGLSVRTAPNQQPPHRQFQRLYRQKNWQSNHDQSAKRSRRQKNTFTMTI